MRMFFVGVTLMLVLLSLVAWRIQPRMADAGKVPLVWVSDDNPARREQIALFNRLHPQLNLRLDPNNGGTQKVIVQSVAGVGPDLFDSSGQTELAAYVKSGVAWDITDELVKAGIDLKSLAWDVSYPSVIYEGRAYGFPTNAGASAIWFNKDVFDRCGVPYPKSSWTWRDLVKIAQRLTIRDENGRVAQYGFIGGLSVWQQFIRQWGGRVYTEDGTRCTLGSPEAIAAIEFLHDMSYKYRVMPSAIDEANMATSGGWGSGYLSMFASGKFGMALSGRFWLCTMRDMNNIRVGVVECPGARNRLVFGGARATLINKNSPRRKQALEFLEYLASRDYNQLVNHQADGLAPVKKFCYTPQFLHDPEYPDEDYNQIWLDTMKNGVQLEASSFVNNDNARRIVQKQLDLVWANQKSPTEALRTAARQVNQEIQATIRRDPELQERYNKLVRRNVDKEAVVCP